MKKYLVTIEFRYSDAPRHSDDYTSKTKKVTIGVYDDFDEACKHGNALMENLESKFPIHKFPGGSEARRYRFSKTGGCFGSKQDLITDMAYLKTPFSFFAKIATLNHDAIDDVIDDVIGSAKRYREYKLSLQDD
jgi:hypothetical protein